MQSKTCIWLAYLGVGWILGYLFKLGSVIGMSPFVFFCALAKPYFGWKKILLLFNVGILFQLILRIELARTIGLDTLAAACILVNLLLLLNYRILKKTSVFEHIPC